jgi:hypothetical protein
MPPPSQPTEPISEQDQETAQKFWGLQFLGSSLWAETRDKLQSPQMKKALSDVWPEICQEPDEEQKAKHLLGVLKLTGKCAAFDHVRLAFAILDPLACRFSDVGPKVMGIEKDCQPRPGEKIVR